MNRTGTEFQVRIQFKNMEKPQRLRNQPLHSTCGILLGQFLQNTGTLFQLKLKSNVSKQRNAFVRT